jgi:hypothetical protein
MNGVMQQIPAQRIILAYNSFMLHCNIDDPEGWLLRFGPLKMQGNPNDHHLHA